MTFNICVLVYFQPSIIQDLTGKYWIKSMAIRLLLMSEETALSSYYDVYSSIHQSIGCALALHRSWCKQFC